MTNKLLITVALATLSTPLIALADNTMPNKGHEGDRAMMGETKDQTRFRMLVKDSAEAYMSIAKGSHGEVPKSVLNNALCIGVLPSVMTGAFVVGGTHGEGLVSCKKADNSWSQPATISINQGSIGLQAGAKSADVVMYFQTQQAVKALKSGNFAFSADVSAVAGTYDSQVDVSNAGVLVYTASEGLFVGASVNGSKIGKEQDMLERYYGVKIDYTKLLDGQMEPDSKGYTQNLTKLFP